MQIVSQGYVGSIGIDTSYRDTEVYLNDVFHTYGRIIDSGLATKIWHNRGYVTESKGFALVPNGSTSVEVNHGLSYTPSVNDIQLQPTNSLGDVDKFFPSNPTSTQFTINVDEDPNLSSGATFSWRITKEP